MISMLRKTGLTLFCAGLLAGNFGCGPKDDAPAPTIPPPAAAPTTPPATNAPSTTGADATTPGAPTSGSPAPATPANGAAANAGKTAVKPEKPGKKVKLPDGLEYTDVKIGTGAMPQDGLNVIVHYTGTLTNGTKFDSSLDRNEPFSFLLGGGQVIKGWDEGVRGMKVGGVRKLVIPYELGYGKEGRPPEIPGSSTLLFTIELLDVK